MSNFYQTLGGCLYCRICGELMRGCTCPSQEELEAAKDEEADRKRAFEILQDTGEEFHRCEDYKL